MSIAIVEAGITDFAAAKTSALCAQLETLHGLFGFTTQRPNFHHDQQVTIPLGGRPIGHPSIDTVVADRGAPPKPQLMGANL